MAHPSGFEPETSPFGGVHSIQLSYGCLLLTQCLREFFVGWKARNHNLQVIVFSSSFHISQVAFEVDIRLRRGASYMYSDTSEDLLVGGTHARD